MSDEQSERGIVWLTNAISQLRLVRGPLYKSALLMAPFFFMVVCAGGNPPRAHVSYAFFFQMLLFLTFAYAVNDWADRECDRASGKRRLLAMLPPGIVVCIVVVLAVANVCLGLVIFPTIEYQAVLISGLIAGWAYSAPPLRLKSAGTAGVVFAPVLGKVIPLFMAAIATGGWGWWLVVLIAAEWTKNAIDILYHQVVDHGADLAGGVDSHVVRHGIVNSQRHLVIMARIGVLAAIAEGITFAIIVPAYRFVLLLNVVGAVALAAVRHYRPAFGSNPALAEELPLSYRYAGYVTFFLAPVWLSFFAALATPALWPLFVLLTLITAAQTHFYLRYRYY